MSRNQSRSDKSEAPQHRKTGRFTSFGQQRVSAAHTGSGKGGGSGASGPQPVSSSLTSNRSFKKSNNNAQGVQARVSGSGLISESSHATAVPRSVQNGAHGQPPLHGAPNAPAAGAAVIPANSSFQKVSEPDPKTSSSNAAGVSSDKMAPKTPAKGDASRGLHFQFGSLSPGLMNRVQIPARTSSAPPNLDEQKRDQARHAAYRAAPVPIPSVPRPQLPRKDAGLVDQSSSREAHSLSSAKNETQIPSVLPATQTPIPSVHSMSGASMQMPCHQPQVPVQFGRPHTQNQPPGMTVPSSVPLPIGSAPQAQQQMFVPGLQHHSMPPQGIMPQGPGMSFTTHMAPQLDPHLGKLGNSITSQYGHQQSGQYGGARKPIKITDPKTHEELKLNKQAESYLDGGLSALRSHSNPPQTQPIPTFSHGHPINYYTSSYNPNLFYPTSSLPMTSAHIAPSFQAPRLNYPVGQASQTVPYKNSSALNSAPANKSGNSLHGISDSLNSAPAVVSPVPLPAVQVTVGPAAVFVGEKAGSISSPAVEKDDLCKLSKMSGEDDLGNPGRDYEKYSERSQQNLKPGHELLAPKSLAVESKQTVPASVTISLESQPSNTISSASSAVLDESPAVVINAKDTIKESLSRSSSIKDQKKPAKKGHAQTQVGGLSKSVSSLPSTALGHGISFKTGVSENIDVKTSLTSIKASEVMLESSKPLRVDAVIPKSETDGAVSDCKLSVVSYAGNSDETVQTVPYIMQDGFAPQDEHLTYASAKAAEQKDVILPEEPNNAGELPSDLVFSKSLCISKQVEKDPVVNVIASNNGVSSLGTAEGKKPVGCDNDDRLNSNSVVSTSTSADAIHTETGVSNSLSSAISDAGRNSSPGASLSRSDSMCSKGAAVVNSSIPDKDSATILPVSPSEATLKHEAESAENINGSQAPFPVSGSKDKPALVLGRSKSSMARGKKKRRELLQKADAAGTTSDLYMAYKGPEDKKETAITSEITEVTSSSKHVSSDVSQEDAAASEGDPDDKAEPDDWEDAADISTPKVEASNNRERVRGVIDHDGDGLGVTAKKYSRDFLLKFSDQFITLPDNFNVNPDIEALIFVNVNKTQLSDRESYSNSGRIRPPGGPRLDRQGSGLVDDDKWSKLQGAFVPGRDVQMDIGYGGNVLGFRPGQGGNYGVSRAPRAQIPSQYVGGVISGPMRSPNPLGGLQQRHSPDTDKWQRATNFQKGLFPSPPTPMQVMHKAEKKYEVGKVTDEEQAKQRQLKAILNKLTPQNFEKLFEQVKAVNIDNAVTLTGIISQIFDKALMEPTFCEMYANFCSHLSVELPDFSEDNEKITFKRLLLNKCQEEFERGEREQEEANRIDEGEIKQTEEEREEKRLKARRRMLGNIRLIGELYKKRMLTERIMHECIKKLFGQCQIPEEEDIEALCKLMSTIGEMIDHPKAKEHLDAYFERMAELSNNMKLSSRVRFMLKDSIDLRKNKWQQRRKIEGPKKIDEVHRDAAQERAQVSRMPRGLGVNPSGRRPMDFGSRGSNISPSLNVQVGGYRGLPTHGRGSGTQDARLDNRHSYEGQPLSVPLSQRPIGDDSITLIPQGGLARGMSRGQPSISSSHLADTSPSSGDSRRMTSGLNGYSSIPERTGYSARDDAIPRHVPQRFARDQLNVQECNMPFGGRDMRNPDRGLDRSPAISLHTEEHLRDMSFAAIKEFYSARDEKEVALCIKDLNSPGFHPIMISIWVSDSFERKDAERDLLAKLLVNHTKSQDAMLNQLQLIKGFEDVLTTLEDAVNDAPRAAEFLGRIFAKLVLEEVVSLREVGRLIYEGGEEPGKLREAGLAAEVLGTTLETIKSEKGDSVLNEIRAGSGLRLDDFTHPDPHRSRKLQLFI